MRSLGDCPQAPQHASNACLQKEEDIYAGRPLRFLRESTTDPWRTFTSLSVLFLGNHFFGDW